MSHQQGDKDQLQEMSVRQVFTGGQVKVIYLSFTRYYYITIDGRPVKWETVVLKTISKQPLSTYSLVK